MCNEIIRLPGMAILVKVFATKNCTLCAKERTAILKQSKSNPQLLINSNNKIYGVYRHHPHFHKNVKQTTPTSDGSNNDKRVKPTHKVATNSNRCNLCLTFCLARILSPYGDS